MDIFSKKTDLMRFLQFAVSRGSAFYVAGIVQPEKAAGLVKGFTDRYGTGMTKEQRSRAKKKGIAAARLFMHPDPWEKRLHWWMLLTDGEHPARSAEKNLHDCRDDRHRLTLFKQCELVLLPRRASEGGEPEWTWRLTGAYYAELLASARNAIRRGHDGKLAELIRSMHQIPGFGGVRRDVWKLREAIWAEWNRSRRGGSAAPLPPKIQGFVRPRSPEMIPLDIVVQRLLADEEPLAAPSGRKRTKSPPSECTFSDSALNLSGQSEGQI